MSEKRHSNLAIHHTDGHHVHRGPVLKRAKWIGAGIILALLVGAAITVIERSVHATALAQENATQNKLFVSTINPKPANASNVLTLPGSLQGITETTLYARTPGYVKRWNKDIGSHVNKGDVLAELDTPEVDEQLAQAIAAKEQAASSLELAKSSAERWEALRKKDAVTEQEVNERSSAFTQAKANLAAAQANVDRLRKLEEFKRIVAPFSGIVTRRNVEVGDLVDAGNGGTAKALFSVAQVETLHTYLYVPQTYSSALKIGDTVKISQPELRGQTFAGTIAHTAGAIDPVTRTLQVEVSIPNKDGKLLAGAYVQAALPVNASSKTLNVPSNVLLFRPDGTKVAKVDDNGKVTLQTVSLGTDLGNTIDVLDGLNINDKLVLNPPDSLAQGDVVTVVASKAAEPGKKATP